MLFPIWMEKIIKIARKAAFAKSPKHADATELTPSAMPVIHAAHAATSKTHPIYATTFCARIAASQPIGDTVEHDENPLLAFNDLCKQMSVDEAVRLERTLINSEIANEIAAETLDESRASRYISIAALVVAILALAVAVVSLLHSLGTV